MPGFSVEDINKFIEKRIELRRQREQLMNMRSPRPANRLAMGQKLLDAVKTR